MGNTISPSIFRHPAGECVFIDLAVGVAADQAIRKFYSIPPKVIVSGVKVVQCVLCVKMIQGLRKGEASDSLTVGMHTIDSGDTGLLFLRIFDFNRSPPIYFATEYGGSGKRKQPSQFLKEVIPQK